MKNEIWKDVPGYEGLYEVSSIGSIKSHAKRLNMKAHVRTNEIRKPWLDGRGYAYIQLFKNSVMKRLSVHRLVAMAFIPNPSRAKEVNHKNANPRDNSVENLEWCTRQENMRHARDNFLFKHGEESHFSKFDSTTVRIIKEAHKAGFRQCEIADYLKMKRQTVNAIVLHVWKHIQV